MAVDWGGGKKAVGRMTKEDRQIKTHTNRVCNYSS